MTLPRFTVPCSVALLVLAGCHSGSDYHPPALAVPDAYRETAGWTVATPADDRARGPWWTRYGDAQLDRLEAAVAVSNQTLQAAAANLDAARAQAAEAGAAGLPTLAVQAQETHSHSQLNKLSGTQVTRNVSLAASWEPDLWGQWRHSRDAAQAGAEASRADLASATLSVQAELATDYFRLCALDAHLATQAESLDAYRRVQAISDSRYRAGVAPKSELAAAIAETQAAEAARQDLVLQRATLEHAIALLAGQAPSALAVDTCTLPAAVPEIPPALPGTLLERRPDIAAAERRVAAANAGIGVQQAGYFPPVVLTASGGYQGVNEARWIAAPERLWALGAAISENLFDGGARRARVAGAEAAFNAAAANYRQTVLNAFREVEDDLAALRLQGEQRQAREAAQAAADEAFALAQNRYRAGVAAYPEVATAAQAALAARQNAQTAHAEQLVASIALIRALGGVWDEP